MPDPTKSLHNILDLFTRAVATYGFEAVSDAVSAWENARADDDDQPDWHEVLASGIRHALEVAKAADDCADTCHIRIEWSDTRRALSFGFDATGAGPTLTPIIERAVRKAARGET